MDLKMSMSETDSAERDALSTTRHHWGSVPALHDWDVTPREAVVLQRDLASQVILTGVPGEKRCIAGCDVSVRQGRVRAAVVVWDRISERVLDMAIQEDEVCFPYVPGLLSFREIPALIPALAGLAIRPDVLMMDGQGIAHPRRIGLATHVGLWYDIPAIGVAKSRLTGKYDDPEMMKGSRSPLTHKDELIGWVLRTRTGVKPVFVSPGHRMDFEEAVDLTMMCALRYRLPEPTRLAHLLSKNGTL